MWHRDGTIAVTFGSASIIGTGTNWADIKPGSEIIIDGETTRHEVEVAVSATQIILTDPVVRATASGLAYGIIPAPETEAELLDAVAEVTAPMVSATVTCTPGGNANAIALATQPGFEVIGNQQLFVWQAIGTNNGPPTANINGSGALPIVMPGTGKPVPAGTIRVGHAAVIRKNAAGTRYDLLSPAAEVQPSQVMLIQTNTSGAALQARIAHPGIKLPPTLADVEYVLQVAAEKPVGGASIAISDYDGVTPILPASTLRDAAGNAILPGAWRAGDTIRFRRYPTGIVHLVQAPTTEFSTATEQQAAVAMEIPPVKAPVLVRRLSEREWQIEIAGIETDTSDDKSNSDVHIIRLHDQSPLVSQGILKSNHAFALHSHMLRQMGGGRFDYANVVTQELTGGNYDSIQPSTSEGAMRVGLMSHDMNGTFGDGSPQHDFIGLGHGLIENVSAVMSGEYIASGNVYATRNDLLSAIGIGKAMRFRTFTVTSVYDICRPPKAAPSPVGQMIIEHRFTKDGVSAQTTWKVGRSLAFDAGSAEISEGDVITGGTSAASATVVVLPSTSVAGTWAGGDCAGTLFVHDVTGAFVDGEPLEVGGVQHATVDGTLGPQISMQNSYANMAPCTVVNRAKAAGLPATEVGTQSGILSGNWVEGASRVALWHTRAPSVLFEMIMQKRDTGSWVEAPCPIDPPGDFSEASTSVLFVQDREEGVRKVYANARSGTVPEPWEGTYVCRALYRFRVGSALYVRPMNQDD
ncbi:MAG: hypothetical protein AB8B60_04930 [Sulfitobacter sp.]